MILADSQIRLGAFIQAAGRHIDSWRCVAAPDDAGLHIARYRELVRTAERGTFDLVFVADRPGADFAAHSQVG